MRVGYHASVAFLDEQVGRVLDALDQRQLSDNTLVIFTSDYGDMLGDHRLLVKGAFFYDACTRVPLLMRWPQQLAGAGVVTSPVQLHDLAATILAAARIPSPRRDGPRSARDLRAVVGGVEATRPAICHYLESGVDAYGRYFDPPIYASMICDGRFKLNVYWQDQTRRRFDQAQLFDLQTDRDEMTNLIHAPEFQAVQQRLTTQLRQAVSAGPVSAGPENQVAH